MRNRLLALTAALLLLGASVAVAKDSFPEVISLPNGFQPEGIAIGDGTTFYVGSIPTGAIYRGDIRTGQGTVLIQGAPGPRRDRPEGRPTAACRVRGRERARRSSTTSKTGALAHASTSSRPAPVRRSSTTSS